MPLHIAPRDPMNAFEISGETRQEGWETAFAQCRTHADTMALWSEAWSRWNSPVARARWNNRDAVVMAERARAASLAEIRAAAVSAAVGE